MKRDRLKTMLREEYGIQSSDAIGELAPEKNVTDKYVKQVKPKKDERLKNYYKTFLRENDQDSMIGTIQTLASQGMDANTIAQQIVSNYAEVIELAVQQYQDMVDSQEQAQMDMASQQVQERTFGDYLYSKRQRG